MMSQLLLGSSVSLLVEFFFFTNDVIFVKNPSSCVKPTLSAYCAISYCIISWFTLCFQLGWGIFGIVVYSEFNSCSQNLTFTDAVALVIVIYFLANIFKLTCSCCFKMCTCVSIILATGKTEADHRRSV